MQRPVLFREVKMFDRLIRVNRAFRQSVHHMQGQQASDLDAQIARLRILNRTEVDLARAISRMLDEPTSARRGAYLQTGD